MYVTIWIPLLIGLCMVSMFVGMIVVAARANVTIGNLNKRIHELVGEQVNKDTHGKALKGL